MQFLLRWNKKMTKSFRLEIPMKRLPIDMERMTQLQNCNGTFFLMEAVTFDHDTGLDKPISPLSFQYQKFCDCCAGDIDYPAVSLGAVHGVYVRCCSVSCFHRLQKIWSPTKKRTSLVDIAIYCTVVAGFCVFDFFLPHRF